MATKRSFIANKGYVCVLGHVRLFATSWTVACQASLSMGFSRQEYWSGLPFPSAGNIPDPRIKPTSLMSPALAGGFFTTSATWDMGIRVISFSYFQGYILCLDTVFYTSKHTHTQTHTHTHTHTQTRAKKSTNTPSSPLPYKRILAGVSASELIF